MQFFKTLDTIMRQDIGKRGLLPSLPASPLAETAASLAKAKRAILLTGFPVRLPDGDFVGETDGPSGTANLAYALTEAGCEVIVVTDRASFRLLEAALSFRAPLASLMLLPEHNVDIFISNLLDAFRPTHFISLERPGKAANGHYHNMRGEIIDDMLADSAPFLSAAKIAGADTISIGDGGNEMGMGTFHRQITTHVPFGGQICAAEGADLTLGSGVSNWWGWGLASLLSLQTGRFLLPTEEEETELLHRVIAAGGVDGCTKQRTFTVDNLSLAENLAVLNAAARLTKKSLGQKVRISSLAS